MRSERFLWCEFKPTLIILCYSLLLSGLVSGCGARWERDNNLLTSGPCAPPCWHNIIPGVSDEDDVRSQLESDPLVRDLHYGLTEEWGIPLAMFSWRSWQAPDGRSPHRIYLRDGKVLRIEIELNSDLLTLGEVVNKYGPPESLLAYAGLADFYWYTVILDYPSRGLTLRSFSLINPKDIADGTAPLSEGLSITGIDYYGPTSLENALSEVYLLPPEEVKDAIAYRQPWPGFGRIRLVDQ